MKTSNHRMMAKFKDQRFNFLQGLLRDDSAVFRRVLHGMWFALYPRAHRVKGSCAFEHVFLGEVKSGQVNGFHNWLFFLLVSFEIIFIYSNKYSVQL